MGSSFNSSFLTQSIDKMMQTHLRNQDAVLDHQTQMVESLLQSQNTTEQMDNHFFTLIREVRRGYQNIMSDLESRIINPLCPSVTPVMYLLAIGLLISMFVNVLMFYLLLRRATSR